jgi:hypothetical protein
MMLSAIIRVRDSKVFKHIADFGRQSLRKIGLATGLSKDRVARSIKSLEKRNKYPESHLWETDEGQAWLLRMFVAVLFEFGVKGNQGADRMSSFFKRLHLDTHIGVSVTALLNQKRQIEEKIADFQRNQEIEQAKEGNEKREIIAGGDETFFDERVMLVLMDLVSGYLVVEEEAADRSYESWRIRAQSRLEQLGLRVRHFISDRGKSLMKLATAGLGCYAGADLFHAQYEISKWLGQSLHGKLGRTCKQLKEEEAKLVSLEKKEAASEKIEEQKQRVEQHQKRLDIIEEDRDAYRKAQQCVSEAVHAFSIDENQAQTSEQVENRLEKQAQCFEEIAAEQSVQDKRDAAGKFRRQIKDVASIVDAWWLWTRESLSEYELGKDLRHWMLYILLPVLYWHHQLQKTQNPEMRKTYEIAWKKAHCAYKTHPLTATIEKADLERWQCWGEWACGNFHRTSSAIEGRNGALSQSYHNGRGLTKRRQRALTAIHNYDTKRSDGTTPAQRLYGRQFEDMFEWLLGQMEALPQPRKARVRIPKNPLEINTVAA